MKKRNVDRNIDWNAPNWWTFFLFLCAFVIAAMKPGNPVREFLLDQKFVGGFMGGVSGLVRITTRFYANRIEDFEPCTALEAKRANEQIKSLSGAINAFAASIAVGVSLKQFWEAKPDYMLIILSIGLAVWVHTGARHLLGLLKDESISVVKAEE